MVIVHHYVCLPEARFFVFVFCHGSVLFDGFCPALKPEMDTDFRVLVVVFQVMKSGFLPLKWASRNPLVCHHFPITKNPSIIHWFNP